MKNSITQSLNHSFNHPITQSPNYLITPARVRAGLTFVELLLAVAVFAILLTGLSSHLRGSVVVWRRVTSTTEHLQRIRVTFDRLRNDLAQAFVFAPSGSSWTPEPIFQEAKLSCYTLQSGQNAGQPQEVVVVTYRLADSQNTKTLIRQVQTPQEAHAAHANPSPNHQGKEEQPLKDVETLAIEYGAWSLGEKKIAWPKPWDFSKNGLPQLVKVTVTFHEGASEPRIVQQTFIIPIGAPLT